MNFDTCYAKVKRGLVTAHENGALALEEEIGWMNLEDWDDIVLPIVDEILAEDIEVEMYETAGTYSSVLLPKLMIKEMM